MRRRLAPGGRPSREHRTRRKRPSPTNTAEVVCRNRRGRDNRESRDCRFPAFGGGFPRSATPPAPAGESRASRKTGVPQPPRAGPFAEPRRIARELACLAVPPGAREITHGSTKKAGEPAACAECPVARPCSRPAVAGGAALPPRRRDILTVER